MGKEILEWIMLVDHFFKRLRSKDQRMPWNLPFVSQCCTSTWNTSGSSPKSWEDERQLWWEQRLKEQEQNHTGRGQACAECDWNPLFASPESRSPVITRVAGNSEPEHRAQTRSQWWKPSASFNFKLLGWSWHPHKNNAYYVYPSHSPAWLNDNSYLTEHWKLLLHHIVDLSITNSLLGK